MLKRMYCRRLKITAKKLLKWISLSHSKLDSEFFSLRDNCLKEADALNNLANSVQQKIKEHWTRILLLDLEKMDDDFKYLMKYFLSLKKNYEKKLLILSKIEVCEKSVESLYNFLKKIKIKFFATKKCCSKRKPPLFRVRKTSSKELKPKVSVTGDNDRQNIQLLNSDKATTSEDLIALENISVKKSKPDFLYDIYETDKNSLNSIYMKETAENSFLGDLDMFITEINPTKVESKISNPTYIKTIIQPLTLLNTLEAASMTNKTGPLITDPLSSKTKIGRPNSLIKILQPKVKQQLSLKQNLKGLRNLSQKINQNKTPSKLLLRIKHSNNTLSKLNKDLQQPINHLKRKRKNKFSSKTTFDLSEEIVSDDFISSSDVELLLNVVVEDGIDLKSIEMESKGSPSSQLKLSSDKDTSLEKSSSESIYYECIESITQNSSETKDFEENKDECQIIPLQNSSSQSSTNVSRVFYVPYSIISLFFSSVGQSLIFIRSFFYE